MKKQIIKTSLLPSEREQEVLLLLGQGKTVAQTAAKLGVALKTVHCYVSRLKSKLKVENLHELMRIAVLVHAGLISIKSIEPE